MSAPDTNAIPIPKASARPPLMLMATRDNSAAQQLGDEYGVTLWFEAFADRAYDSAALNQLGAS